MEPTGPPRRVAGPSYITTGTAPLVGRRAELDWLGRQLEAVASGEPRLVFVDDIQWIDTLSLELLRHLVLETADSSLREPLALMVLCTHRPGLDIHLEADLARLRREECASVLELH